MEGMSLQSIQNLVILLVIEQLLKDNRGTEDKSGSICKGLHEGF